MPQGDSHIIFLDRKDIDVGKWDSCIENSQNGLIYAKSFFLDGMSRHWSGLVWNDYEVVMPLTWNRKWSIYYLYQPAFTAVLGVYGNLSREGIVNEFLYSIPKKFKYIDISLHEGNLVNFGEEDSPFMINKRVNLVIPLTDDSAIQGRYKRLARRMLRKATEYGISVLTESSPKPIVDFYYQHYSHKHPDLRRKDFDRLIDTCSSKEGQKQIQCYRAIAPSGEMLAGYLLLFDKKNIYSVLGGSSAKGRDQGAFYLLTDYALRHNRNKDKLFRFEGSDHKGIALFDKQFGPMEINYPQLKSNRLPWPLRLLKD